MVLILQSKQVDLISTRNVYFQSIYNGKQDTYVPENHDVTSISLETIPFGLASVCIEIGCQKVISIDVAEIKPGVNILSDLLPLSKANYMITRIGLCYDQEYLYEHEMFRMIDEEIDEEELSETETEFFDGYDYHFGFRVLRKSVSTGNKIRQVTGAVQVELPEIHIGTIKSSLEVDKPAYYEIWQDIMIVPQTDGGKIRILSKDFKLTTCDGSSIEDATSRGIPFKCKVRNFIRFHERLAGLMYMH